MDPVSRVVIRSLAKINLDLRVLQKRTDGFHELRTIFQTVSLADTIEIEFDRADPHAVARAFHGGEDLSTADGVKSRAAFALVDQFHQLVRGQTT